MKFRLRCETLEVRDNPSGPELLDPIAPITSDPTTPVTTEPAPEVPIIDPFLGIDLNPWGT